MNRLWVQFSLAITLAIILVSLSPMTLILLENWLNPPILLEDETGLPPTLAPAEVDHLLETLAELGIRPLKVDLYPNGYFSIETDNSLTQALTQVETIFRVLSSEQIGKLDIYFENYATAENPTLQTHLSISGRVTITEMDAFAQRFPPGQIEIFTDPFLGENPSIIDTLQLFSEEIVRAIIVGLVLGVGLGIWLSRTLTAPLRHLAEAARVIGARELSYRVKVKGSKEVKDLADTFNQMSANLERAEQVQRQMMADVSHELRTPLTVLEGNLRAALDRVARLDEQNLADLYSQTHHLIRLVNDLHEIAQAETKQLSLALQETDVAELVRQTVDIFAPLAEEEGISLKCEVAAGLQPVRIDCSRLRQVLHNLLANAVRHTPGSGTITLTVNQDTRATHISVTDTGEGIAPEHLTHIFDRFYRTDDSRSRETGGAGLGLAIVKAIVEAHGGTVTAVSPGLNCGASFTLTLPNL